MTKTLYILTLEPVEKRYTKQWHKHFKKEFSNYFSKVINIDGTPQGDEIKKGRFLDINQTNIWKAEQTIKVAELFAKNKVKDGDIFFFADAWHFGVTAVKYMSQLNGIKTKLYGYWHAGTYDPNDFVSQAGLGSWAEYNEIGWFRALDASFVATNAHKELILESYFGEFKASKIKVVGFPMDWDAEIRKEIGDYEDIEKENIVVFPHRTDPEKNPQDFKALAKKFPEYKFIITTDVTKTKKEYYEILAKAKVVFNNNKQETFGIGTVEAMFLGAMPLVPNRLVFPELYFAQFVCNNKNHMADRLKMFMEKYDTQKLQKPLRGNIEKIKKQSLSAVEKMAQVMLK